MERLFADDIAAAGRHAVPLYEVDEDSPQNDSESPAITLSDSDTSQSRRLGKRTRISVSESSKRKKPSAHEALLESILVLAKAMTSDIGGNKEYNMPPLERAVKLYSEEFEDTVPYEVTRKIYTQWESNERTVMTFVTARKAYRRAFVNDIMKEVLGPRHTLSNSEAGGFHLTGTRLKDNIKA